MTIAVSKLFPFSDEFYSVLKTCCNVMIKTVIIIFDQVYPVLIELSYNKRKHWFSGSRRNLAADRSHARIMQKGLHCKIDFRIRTDGELRFLIPLPRYATTAITNGSKVERKKNFFNFFVSCLYEFISIV